MFDLRLMDVRRHLAATDAFRMLIHREQQNLSDRYKGHKYLCELCSHLINNSDKELYPSKHVTFDSYF
jgi:hypothetical protein